MRQRTLASRRRVTTAQRDEAAQQREATHYFFCTRCLVRWLMASFTDPQLREILLTSPTIAVVGIHNEPEKAAYYVPEYLHDEGYRIFGINPRFAGEELFGNRV